MAENWKNNPWAIASDFSLSGHTVTCDSTSRIEQIKRSEDVRWLATVVQWKRNQIAVTTAAERRLKILLAKAGK